MRTPRLERLFLRWRDRGDARALTRVFDEAAPELLALASHLVQDPAVAEDLVQSTFLVAIERAERFDGERRLVPWLVGVLVHEARSSRRDAARVVDPERLSPRQSPDASEGAERLELSDALEQALAGLPERDRRVLRPYLEDGRAPRDIAAETGVAPGTVRVRIHRGLERLRKALPTGLSLGALGLPQLKGLAGIRAEVLSAAHGAGVASVAAPIVLAGVSSLAVSGVVAGTVGVAALGWWLVGTDEGPVAELERPSASALAADAELERVTPELRAPEPEPEPEPAPELEAIAGEREEIATRRPAATVAPSTPRLVGSVSGLFETDVPVSMIVHQRDAGIGGLVHELHADGELSVDLSRAFSRDTEPPAQLAVLIEHPDYEPIETSAARSGEREWSLELVLTPRGGTIRGRITTAEGIELDLREVRVAFRSRNEHEGITSARQAADSSGNPELTALFSRHTIFGNRFDELGSEHCDAGGGFEMKVAPARPGFLVVRHPTCALLQLRVEFASDKEIDVGELVLDQGLAVEGQAFHAGVPLQAGGEVIAWSPDEEVFLRAPSDVTWDGERFRHTKRVTEVSQGGYFRIDGLAPGEVELTVVPHEVDGRSVGYTRVEGDGVVVPVPSSRLRLDGKLRRAEVHVVGDSGELLSRANVRRRAKGGNPFGDPGNMLFGNPVDAGVSRFWIHDEVEFDLEIKCPGFAKRDMTVRAQDFEPYGRLVVALERVAQDATLTYAFVGPGAEGLDGSLVSASWFADGFQFLGPARVTDGRAVFPGAPAGAYEASLQLHPRDDLAPDAQPYGMVVGGKIPDSAERGEPVPVDVALGGRIRLFVSGLAADAPPVISLSHEGGGRVPTFLVPTPDGGSAGVKTIESGVPHLVRSALIPGTYVLSQTGDAYEAGSVEVQVRAGETAEVHLALRRR